MPRYHFNVHDGHSLPDADGTQLADSTSARREAIRLTGMILAEDVFKIGPGESWQLEVTDHIGVVLFRLNFTVVQTAAVKPLHT